MTGTPYFRFEAKARENPWLDLVRAMAIVVVLLRHGEIALVRSAPVEPTLLGTVFLNGWVGVDLFFVLSGYLISRHLLNVDLGGGRFPIRAYLTGRALRIVPAYVAALLLTAGGLYPLYTLDPTLLHVRVAYHLLFLQDYLPANINVAFWSLGVEEKFYLLAPLLIAAIRFNRHLCWCIALLVTIALLSVSARTIAYAMHTGPLDYTRFFTLLRSPFHVCFEPLAAGVLIATLQQRGYLASATSAGKRILAIATLVALLAMSQHDMMARITWFDVIAQPIFIAATAATITIGAVLLRDTRMHGTTLVRPLSRLSYSLYLVHLPLTALAIHIAEANTTLFWLVYLSTSLILAAGLHFAVEKPFLLLKNRMSHGESYSHRAPILS